MVRAVGGRDGSDTTAVRRLAWGGLGRRKFWRDPVPSIATHRAQEIALTGLLQRLGQRQSLSSDANME